MVNVNATWDQATPHRCGISLIALFATLQQIQIGRSARVFVRLNVPIKAFITEFFCRLRGCVHRRFADGSTVCRAVMFLPVR